MLEVNREKVKQVFASYTDNYNINDPKIHLKIDHTYRVADLCDEIAKTVPGVNPDLAWLSGMLHDIGRFEQIKRYNTFSDAKSVDHAQFGADLLFKDNLKESFGNYDRECNDILETAIRNHNKLVIDEDVPDSYRPYCNILRDADKIDILRVNIDTPPEDIYNVSSEELRNAGVSETVKQVFKEGRAIPRSIRMTSADVMVSHICLVHELVYPISKQIVRDQGYLNRMLDFPSDNEDTREWFEYMKKSLEELVI